MDSELENLDWNDDKISTSQVSERSRPTTPKWWRPSYPPETYEWEEMRRKRKLGGYPWTHLDKAAQKSDNIYEAVNPLDFHGSGFIEGDPETSSLDRHTFYNISPELDIVTSEGLDGLDQPDPHDFGMDGDKEWSLYDDEKPPPSPKMVFAAGIRKHPPKVGETSRMRPLKQVREISPSRQLKETHYEPIHPPLEMQAEEEVPRPEPLHEQDSKPRKEKLTVKARLEKISLAVKPKLPKLSGVKLLRKKRLADSNLEAEKEPTPGPSADESRQVKIRFDDTLDLTLQQSPESSKLEEPATEFEDDFEQVEPIEPSQDEIETRLELERLRAEEKWEQDRIREEAKRLKLETAQREKEAESELRRFKAEEKEAREREKAEEKRLKAEGKLARQREEAEAKKQRQLEQDELKRQKQIEQEEAKRQKQIEQEEAKIQKQLEQEEAKIQKQLELEDAKQRKVQAAEAARIQKEIQKQLAQEASKVAKEFQSQATEEAMLRQQETESQIICQTKSAEESMSQLKEAKTGTLGYALADESIPQKWEEENFQKLGPAKLQKEHDFVETQEVKPHGILKNSRTYGDEAQNELETEIMDSILRENEKATSAQKPKSPSKVQMLKRKIGDINLKKRFKRQSKTPPPRPSPPRFKITPLGETELAVQYKQEMQERMDAMEAEHGQKERLPEPQIYVTQPSIETEQDTHVQWTPMDSAQEEDAENETQANKPQKGDKLKGLSQMSRNAAARTSQKAKVFGTDLKKFGVKMRGKYQEALKEIRAREEARRLAQEEKERRNDSQSESVPTTPAGNVFRFKRTTKAPKDENSDPERIDAVPVIVAAERKKVRGKKEANYENTEFENSTPANSNLNRNSILGRAHRDYWEPSQRSESREVSEEPNFSSHAPSSGWESPSGLSNASSSARGHSRSRQGHTGVLEEIDSDEFFLREKGISEGEDEAEMTRFLVSELRQAFRPTHFNALSAFDGSPPPRPIRSQKKKSSPNFQTFPPERPKRKHRPGYISTYVESLDHEASENEEPEEKTAALRAFESEPESEEEDVGIRRVKAELRKIEDDDRYEPINKSGTVSQPSRPVRNKTQKRNIPTHKFYFNTIAANEWADDEDFELEVLTAALKRQKNEEIVAEEKPIRPKRNSEKSLGQIPESVSAGGIQEVRSSRPTGISGSILEGNGTNKQTIDSTHLETDDQVQKPVQDFESGDFRTTSSERKFGANSGPDDIRRSVPQTDPNELFEDEDLHFVDELLEEEENLVGPSPPPRIPRNRTPTHIAECEVHQNDFQDDDFDGSGYASVVTAMPPATVPRRKRKSHPKVIASLKRRSREFPSNSSSVPSCSLPRFTPRTFHIVPPSRPHRTYSAIRPKPPPRKKVNGENPEQVSQNITAHRSKEHEPIPELRPSSAIMRDRPLPPPPRPPRPAVFTRMNDLDQEALERSLGVSHYANWVIDTDEEEWGANQKAVVEETCTAKNIPLLGIDDEEEVNLGDLTIGIQTDPLTEEEFEDNDHNGSFEEEEEQDRFHKIKDSMQRLSPNDELLDESRDELRHFRDPNTGPTIVTDRVEALNPPNLERRISNGAGPTQIIFPTRLHLDELEVDFLRVNELSAQTLTMGQLTTSQLEAESLSCSGPLLVGSIQVTRPEPVMPLTLADDTMSTPDEHLPSEPPSAFYTLASPSVIPARVRLPVEPSRLGLGGGKTSIPTDPEDDMVDLGMRLGRSVLRSGLRAVNSMMQTLDHILPPDGENEQKQRALLQVMLCVLLLLVTGIFLLTRSTTQHPHWDFYLPPNDIL